MAFFFSEFLLNISFLISDLSQGAGLFRTFNSLRSVFIEDIKKVVFPNVPCLINTNWTRIKLRQWDFFMSDRKAFALNFLKFRVSTYLGLRLGMPILQMAKIRLWSLIDREYTPECTILSALLVIKRSISVEVLLVILVGSLITCVNWYASMILMSRVVYESLSN